VIEASLKMLWRVIGALPSTSTLACVQMNPSLLAA
jgi:hypothetical protein